MARIRTVKPEFFRHEALFEAERDTGLPLRLAYAGLWTAADREGRFKWAPRALKLDCLPYDDVDFSRVLDALWTRGFIVKYAADGVEYGAIPSWSQHQIINNRETASAIPEFNETNTLTREARVGHATGTRLVQVQGEGKGREMIPTLTRRIRLRRLPRKFISMPWRKTLASKADHLRRPSSRPRAAMC